MIRKLRIKFIIINMTIVTVLLGVMLGLVFRFNREAMQTQGLRQMRTLADGSRDPQPPGTAQKEAPLIFFSLEEGPDGELIARGSDYFDLTDPEQLKALLEAAKAAGTETGILEEYNLRFHKGGGPRGEGYHFADIQAERAMLRNLAASCATVGIISFLCFFAVSILLANWAVRPLERAWEQQRQFIADASHELKSPLAVIMANAELLQSEDHPPEDRRRFAASILSVSYQMRALVAQLLDMARLDSLRPTLKELELSQLVLDSVLSASLLYEEKGRGLVYTIPEDIRIRGCENQVYQLLDVLLDNALKYSRGDESVEICLKAQSGSCLLSVSSPGVALTKKQCQDIFKRFYRIDQARTMDGSYGLGLSIAQKIVQTHRGRIWAEPGEGRNVFFVRFPTIH